MAIRFVKNERGSAAIEFALVGPVFVMLFAGILQFGALFYVQAEMGHVARTASRMLSVEALTTTQTSTYVNANTPNWGSGSYTTSVTDGADFYTVTISIPTASLTFFPMFTDILGADLTVSSSMSKEDV